MLSVCSSKRSANQSVLATVVKSPFTLTTFLLAFIFASSAQARWADKEDFGSIIKSEKLVYDVAADGSYVMTLERETEISTEDVRSKLGLYRNSYDARTTKMTLLEASTINGKRVTHANPTDIEIKPLAT